jgi:cell division protein FtsL
VLGLLSALESLAQHRLLDRLIRGRVWIGLVAFALIGIVTLQLGLLKLNGGIGRALEHEALLQRENAALSIENSELAAGTRVEQSAAKLGMAFVPAGALRFLGASGHGDAGKAVAALASAAQAREASAAEASEGEASSETAAASEGSGEESSEASASSGAYEEASSSGESSESSEASSGESAPEAGSAASSETEPSGGSAASSSGG